jgi:hypothetical protein
MSLPGKFGVGASGAATYAIPITEPPGSAGMRPTLTLEYSSQGANGIVGMGWALGGLPAVTRCAQTIEQDGIRGSVNFDNNDRFCLDGQRLFAIGGAYGADGTEYRTEIESFTRVISHGSAGNGPAWFEVHSKSGQVMEFGHSPDSQLLAQGKTTARVWAVNKVGDTKGNYYAVTYTNDPANGQDYPIEIDYTGNAAAGVAPYNKVQFVYATRPDIVPLYQAGSLTRVTVLLSEIQAYAGATLVNDYKLTYQQGSATQRSRLTSVTLCFGDGTCQPATTFNWQEGGSGFSNSSWSSSDPKPANLIPLDLNGDGKTDFVQQALSTTPNGAKPVLVTYISNGDGTFTVGSFNTNCSGCSAAVSIGADINGDGKSDLVYAWNNGAPNGHVTLTSLMSNGDGTFNVVSFDCPTCPYGSAYQGSALHMQAVDLNGDGKTDFIQPWNSGGTLVFITYLSNGDGTFTVGTTSSGNAFDTTGSDPWGFPIGPRLLALDLNGDGKTDLIQQWNNGGTLYFIKYLSNGDGTFTALGSSSSGNGFDSTASGGAGDPGLMVIDLNADGKFDLIQLWNNGGTLYFITYLSKGDGTFAAGSTSSGNGFNSLGMDPTGTFPLGPGLIPLDLNADGKTDLIQQWNNGGTLYLITYLSNGDGTFRTLGSTSTGIATGSPGQVVVGDINGDGLTDLVVAFGSATQLSFKNFIANPPYPDLLTAVTTGLAASTSFTYQPLTSSSIYQKDTTSVYPIFDTQGALYVVSRVDAANGVGGTLSSTYHYAGGKSDINGRGFLGFRQIAVTDLQTGIAQTTNYRQDYPYIGLIASASKSLPLVTLNQTTNTLNSTSLGGTRYQVFTTQTVAQSSDLDGTAVPTVTTSYQYDGFGNVTQMVVTTSDGFSKTTTNTYTNDTTNWLLGRLTAATVTSVGPTPPPPPSPTAPPDMTIVLAHSGNFQTAQTGAAYSITVSNVGTGSSLGTVTVTDTLPAGLTATAMSGTGWSCTLTTLACTRGDALAAGSSYPPITLTVNVALNAPAAVTNVVTVSGGGETNTSNDTANDPTTIGQQVNVTISASANNLNLWNYLVANGLAISGQARTWNVTISGGVVIGSASTSAYAFDTGAFPPGSAVNMINNGIIVGTGGNGGTGGGTGCVNLHNQKPPPGSPGAAGGPAINVQVSVSLTNSGSIWGGGGGGGGAGGGYTSTPKTGQPAQDGGGGGGGAGAVAGGGGTPGGTDAFAGAAGTISSGGAGGASGANDPTVGGAGGGPGQGGAAGTMLGRVSSCRSTAGAGGAAGSAIVGNSLVTWASTGDVRGPLN